MRLVAVLSRLSARTRRGRRVEVRVMRGGLVELKRGERGGAHASRRASALVMRAVLRWPPHPVGDAAASFSVRP